MNNLKIISQMMCSKYIVMIEYKWIKKMQLLISVYNGK